MEDKEPDLKTVFIIAILIVILGIAVSIEEREMANNETTILR